MDNSAYIMMNYSSSSSLTSTGTSWQPDPLLNLHSVYSNHNDNCDKAIATGDAISSSLPNSCHVTAPSIHVTQETIMSSSTTVTNTMSPCAGESGMASSTSCVSLHHSQSTSPVSRFSKLLRNSFSKLKSRRSSLSVKSRSCDILKKGSEAEESETENVSSAVISPINEEMVVASMKKGLPIIPFPCPNFVIIDRNFEDTKVLIRENSYKDIKVPSSIKGQSNGGLRIENEDMNKVNFKYSTEKELQTMNF